MKKITAFVCRNGRKEILLFEHEDRTIQLPAGTVERNEDLLEAGIREACEETGISPDSIISSELLVFSNNDLENDEVVVEESCPVYSRPKETSMCWGKIPRGITVKQLRERDGYYQVQYDDWNDEDKKDYLSYSLIGWIKKEYVSREKLRYYCVLDVKNEQDRWLVSNDNHEFTLFWCSLTELPKEIIPRNKWIKVLQAHLEKDRPTTAST
jgi:8-oxo-dGTP pyrophosphatase MutT (NUDIX family)